MRRSRNTLLGRAHEQVSLEAQGDVAALHRLLDPAIRARRERARRDEPERSLARIRAFVASVSRAEIESVEILDARKRSERQGGRPSALVRARVRYNDEPEADELRTRWVRDGEVWYATAVEGRPRPTAPGRSR